MRFAALFGFSLLSAPALANGTDIIINEVDADTFGTDNMEFIELYGDANASLDGLSLVFYNGSDDASYNAIDLDGHTLDANGFFVVGNAAVTGVDLVMDDNSLQNGADAVALVEDDAVNYPTDTPVSDVNVIDAIVYDTDDSDDAGLIDVLTPGEPQVDERGNGASDLDSNQRCPDGGLPFDTATFIQADPSPGALNNCPVCGDGVIGGDEACDEGSDNGLATSCCTDTCTLRPVDDVCRPDAGTGCDIEEVCDGAMGACPADVIAADGTACEDGTTCNGVETCMSGVCEAADDLTCDDGDACTLDTCAEPDGCAHEPIADCCNVDNDCNDDDECTEDTCDLNTNTCVFEDAGTCDSGETGDTGDSDTDPPDESGCSCNGTGGVASLAWLGGLVLLRRRR